MEKAFLIDDELLKIMTDKNVSYMAKWIAICYMMGIDSKTIMSSCDISPQAFYNCLRENPPVQQLLGVKGFSIITNDEHSECELYGYVYMVRNLENGKIYIGQHKGKMFDDSYYGSGTAIQEALQTFGKEHFSRSVLKWCYTKNELDNAEAKLIQMFKATDPNVGYNLKDELIR